MFDAAATRSRDGVPFSRARLGTAWPRQHCTGPRCLRPRGFDGPLAARRGPLAARRGPLAARQSLQQVQRLVRKRLGPTGQVLGQVLIGAHTTRRTAHRTTAPRPRGCCPRPSQGAGPRRWGYFGLWRVCFPPVLFRTARRLLVEALR